MKSVEKYVAAVVFLIVAALVLLRQDLLGMLVLGVAGMGVLRRYKIRFPIWLETVLLIAVAVMGVARLMMYLAR